MLFSPSLIFYYVELHWPLNYHLSFELCFIVAIAVLLISLVLPKGIEKKRERDTDHFDYYKLCHMYCT